MCPVTLKPLNNVGFVYVGFPVHRTHGVWVQKHGRSMYWKTVQRITPTTRRSPHSPHTHEIKINSAEVLYSTFKYFSLQLPPHPATPPSGAFSALTLHHQALLAPWLPSNRPVRNADVLILAQHILANENPLYINDHRDVNQPSVLRITAF